MSHSGPATLTLGLRCLADLRGPSSLTPGCRLSAAAAASSSSVEAALTRRPVTSRRRRRAVLLSCRRSIAKSVPTCTLRCRTGAAPAGTATTATSALTAECEAPRSSPYSAPGAMLSRSGHQTSDAWRRRAAGSPWRGAERPAARGEAAPTTLEWTCFSAQPRGRTAELRWLLPPTSIATGPTDTALGWVVVVVDWW